jgi:glutamyl-tRNA reductase
MIDYWLKREDDRRDFSPSDEIEEVEEVIEDTTENDMNDVEPAPVENEWWKIYREAKKVIDEQVEFALNQLNQSIQKVPALGYISALAIGFAAILFIINEFVPNVEDLVYGAGLL